jgi:GLPGLI family protein
MKLKYISIILITLFTVNTIIAQDFQGVATYKSHRKVNLKMNNENSEMQKQIQEQIRKQFQQEYTLTFNKNESTYKQNEKLDAPAPAQSGIQISISQGSGVMYKNVKENRFTNKTEMFGKLFLIKDTLSSRKWELVNETKNIGKYTCFKATFSDEYETQTLNEEGELTNETKERITTVWYTPQIPVNNGPSDFHGLPGLILEVNNGDLTLVCSKIVINPKEQIDIVEPKKGKEITQTKFDEIQEKKTQEMMERFHSRRGNGDGGEMIISIGG